MADSNAADSDDLCRRLLRYDDELRPTVLLRIATPRRPGRHAATDTDGDLRL